MRTWLSEMRLWFRNNGIEPENIISITITVDRKDAGRTLEAAQGAIYDELKPLGAVAFGQPPIELLDMRLYGFRVKWDTQDRRKGGDRRGKRETCGGRRSGLKPGTTNFGPSWPDRRSAP